MIVLISNIDSLVRIMREGIPLSSMVYPYTMVYPYNMVTWYGRQRTRRHKVS